MCGVPLSKALQRLKIPRVDVVKIDVEGSELRALKGLLMDGHYLPNHIIFEFLPDHFSYGATPKDLLTFVSGLGYEIVKIDGTPYQFGDKILEENLWARRVSP